MPYVKLLLKTEEWDNTQSSSGQEQKQRPNELAYQVNEMQVHKFEKGIFIGDSAATSHMTSDMTGLYNLMKISSSEVQEYWFNQQPEYRDREEVPPLGQQRRIGLEIDMIGAREENLVSTRNQTLEELI